MSRPLTFFTAPTADHPSVSVWIRSPVAGVVSRPLAAGLGTAPDGIAIVQPVRVRYS